MDVANPRQITISRFAGGQVEIFEPSTQDGRQLMVAALSQDSAQKVGMTRGHFKQGPFAGDAPVDDGCRIKLARKQEFVP